MESAEGERRERERATGGDLTHIPPMLERVDSDKDKPATEKSGNPTTPLIKRGPKRSSRFQSSYTCVVGVISTMDTYSALLATMEDPPFAFSHVM